MSGPAINSLRDLLPPGKALAYPPDHRYLWGLQDPRPHGRRIEPSDLGESGEMQHHDEIPCGRETASKE